MSPMKRAIEISLNKMTKNEGGPFGAVIVKDDNIIAEGWNQVTSCNDPTAHAEVDAIRKACSTLNDFSLKGCEIYTSCEPCPMCLAAIYWARIDQIYFANTREDAALIGFDDNFLYSELTKSLNQRSIPIQQVMHSEANQVFQAWLKKEDRIEY